ncbi:MAG: cytosolic protein [Bacteroidetes bacterium]|nr:cytosolic protein [Bacteroidota bacterium]
MRKLVLTDVINFVEENIGYFHQKRIDNLKKLKLVTILKRKNPYLYKAKNIFTAQDLVKEFLDAHLVAQEEGIFGEFLEGLAIFICNRVYKGQKSAAEGIDLEFNKKGVKYIVTIKSGPNWGNSGQIKKMEDYFRKAKKILKTNSKIKNIESINGCCYGRDNNPDKGDYTKLCGQRFWEFISGDKNLYLDIIEPLGHKAKEKNEEFIISYSKLINQFTVQFNNEYCKNYLINWDKLVKFNSSK